MSFKIRYFLFVLALFGCTSNPKKPQIQSPAPLTITSVDPNVFKSLDFSQISGTDPTEIISYIKEFPLDNYQIVSIQSQTGVDSFCIDDIPDYIKTEIRSGKTWEPHLEPYFIKYCRPGSTVIDIGAHIGTHTLTMSRCVSSQGRVIAFEPQPKAIRELVVNMGLNQAHNVAYFWGGAGKIQEQLTLGTPSLFNEGGVGLGTGSGKLIDVIPLDSMNLTNVSLIKIDVEGMEESVLLGAKETIQKNKPVMIIEICGGNIPERSSPEIRDEIFRRMQMIESLGYKIIRLNDSCDYLALPENSKEFSEVSETKLYRHHVKQLKKWQTFDRT